MGRMMMILNTVISPLAGREKLFVQEVLEQPFLLTEKGRINGFRRNSARSWSIALRFDTADSGFHIFFHIKQQILPSRDGRKYLFYSSDRLAALVVTVY